VKHLIAALLTLLLAAPPIVTPSQASEFRVGDRLKSGAAPARSSRVQEITWDDLLPAGWDPLEMVKGLNLDALDDNDPRAIEAMNKLKAAWQNAPSNHAMAGRNVRIPGFVVPLEFGRDQLREFLLVPYFGACIHVPPPPPNQVIHVVFPQPVKVKSMQAVWVQGTLELASKKSHLGDSSYRLNAAQVEPYREKR